jgi:assimilatory nitrate reductase catalytic subunit
MRVTTADGRAIVSGDERFPVNEGSMCVKGWSAAQTLDHPERLLAPLMRNSRGVFVSATWDDALDRIAGALTSIGVRHGFDAVGVLGGGSLTNEKAYLLGKFARVALRTANVDYNGRFCMSSAAAAMSKAFGIDRGLPFPLHAIADADVVLLAGANPAETMPPLMRHLAARRQNGGATIVADPRRTATAIRADLHLPIAPGTDAALANGILHVLIREGLVRDSFVDARTEGFERVRAAAAAYWPERVERITGVAEADVVAAARMLGTAKRPLIVTARGTEQHAHGVDNVLAFINVALALGDLARPFSSFGTLTGQGNGQGGREHGQKSDQLPGYRRIDDPIARRHVASVWGIAESDLPGNGMSAYEMLHSIRRPNGVRALFVMGTNAAVSAPRSHHVHERLGMLDFLAVCDFFVSETAQLADVVLPSLQWAEEEGTMTTLEGRVVRRRASIAAPEGCRSDIEVLCALASRMGRGQFFRFTQASEVFDELRAASAGGLADYSGITYEKIDEQDGVFWPCPGIDHPGTPWLFASGFFTRSGRARFHPIVHTEAAERPDASYPLVLTTGRVLAQYQSGTQTRRIRRLNDLCSEARAEIHPHTAAALGIRDGERRTIESRRGRGTFTIAVTRNIRKGVLFIPFHWGGESSANALTNDALDPVSRMPEFKACAVRVTRRVAGLRR